MRVLLVNDLPPGPLGGVEVHLDRLIAALEGAGDTVEVFAGEVRHRGAGRLLDIWDPLARSRLAERAGQFRPDVVHHHNVLRELSVSVLGVPRQARQVLTCHDYRLLGAEDPGPWDVRVPAVGRLVASTKARWDRSVARRNVDVVIGVSAAMVAALRRAGFDPVAYVPYFAPSVPSTGATPVDACHDVVFVGRLAPDKGVEVLASAFEQLAPRWPQTRLIAVGDGPERSRLQALSAAVGPGRVVLTGPVGQLDVQAAMAGARVVVVPSIPARRPEGSPMVAIEAAMAGRPLVVSDDPGLRELVDLAGCGIVVPAGDERSLGDAISRLLGDAALSVRMGDAGARLAQRRHSAAAVVGRLRAIYAGQQGLPGPDVGPDVSDAV
jgi:glycosyltransferase involved in cell wall biosynthesis